MKTRLTKEGLYYTGIMLCIFAAGMMRGVNLLFIIAGMMLGPLFFNWRIARNVMRHVRVKRLLPEVLHAGEPFTFQIEMNSVSRHRFNGLTIENPCSAAEVTLKRIQESTPRPRQFSRHLVYAGTFPRRGEYVLTPVRLVSDHPFGFFASSARMEPETVLVFPKLVELPPNWRDPSRNRDGDETTNAGLYAHPTGEFFGLRDWRSGDTRRMIHWRSSAKHMTPMVRQWEQTTLMQVHILADFRLSDEAAFERAVSLTASVLHALCCSPWSFTTGEAGRTAIPSVTLKIFGSDPFTLTGGANYAFYTEAMTHLATVEMPSSAADDAFSPDETFLQPIPGVETVFISSLIK